MKRSGDEGAVRARPLGGLTLALCPLVMVVTSSAAADAIPDLPPPRCDEGFVVVSTHDGPECTRPRCTSDADCPQGLRCTPRRCHERTRDEACVELQRREGSAKGAPDPCEGYVVGELCDEAHLCAPPAFCPAGRCVPPDELAQREESGPERAPASGGGCCGSRGTHAASAVPWVAMGGVVVLGARRGRRRARPR